MSETTLIFHAELSATVVLWRHQARFPVEEQTQQTQVAGEPSV